MDAVAPSKSSSGCRADGRRFQIEAECLHWCSCSMGLIGPMRHMGPICPIIPGCKVHNLSTENLFSTHALANRQAKECAASPGGRQKRRQTNRKFLVRASSLFAKCR